MTSSIDESYVDVNQVGAPGRSTWPLVSRLLSFLLVLMVIGWGVIAAFSLNSFERTVLPELHLKAATVGRSLVSQLSRAIEHGVPPESLLGMKDFLDSALMANPEVSYLVVSNESGRVLFAHGVGVDEAVQRIVFFKMPDDVEAGSFQTFEMGNFYDTSVPMIVRGDLIGYIHVGVRQDFLRDRLSLVFNDLLMLLIASSIMSFYLLQLFLKLRIETPLGAVRKGMFVGAVRDFRFRVQTAAVEDVFRVSRTFNLATRRLSEAYQRLLEEAEESKAAQIDPAVSEQIDNALGRFVRRFRAVFSEERVVLTDDVPLRGMLPLFLLSCAAAFVLLFQSSGEFITISNAAFMLPMTLALVSLLLPSARDSYRLAYQPGLFLAAVGLTGSTFDTELMGSIGWNCMAGLGYGWAAGATLLGMASESTADRNLNPGPPLLGAILFAVTVHSVTAGAGHVATDWLVAVSSVGAVLLGWSIGWPSPVSIAGMQIGPNPSPSMIDDRREVTIAGLATGFWCAGLAATIIGLLPILDDDKRLLSQSMTLFFFFLLVWGGVVFVIARRGRLMPLRLLSVIGGLCAALGIAQIGQAASGVAGLPKLASYLVPSFPLGAAWLGYAAFTIGHAVSMAPSGMLVLAATGKSSWRPDRLRNRAILMAAAAAGFAIGPLVTQLIVERSGIGGAAWVAAIFSGIGALLVLGLPAYERRREPIMIDTMWR